MKTKGDRLQVFRSTRFEFRRSFFKTLTTILPLPVLPGEGFSSRWANQSRLVFGLALALVIFAGCESNPGNVSTSVGFYYGTGFYDPWYYGGAYYPPDVIVTPPPENPDHPGNQPRPEHPIANPPPTMPDRPTAQPQPTRPSAPASRPMPSIPSRPRAGRR